MTHRKPPKPKPKPHPTAGLAALGALHAQLKRQQQEQQAQERARLAALQEAERAAQARQQAFAQAVGPVQRLPTVPESPRRGPPPPPLPVQRERDERQAMQEALSDEVDVESLLLTDDGLSFRRPGVGSDVLAKLRRGHWALQGQLDLHGLVVDEARTQLAAFVRAAHRRGLRCLRVVHGKGLGSPGKQPVLKARVLRWLAQRQEVIAFAQATAAQGGAGALIVLLDAQH